MRQTSLDCVYELAKADKRVVFIGSDIGAGTLANFKAEMPERFFMEGVSEQAIISMAAGLAMEGNIVYVNTIATFITRRCFEQNVLELGLHNLNVRLIASGGGVVYAPLGPTHLALDDIAIMRTIPNMTIVAPADADEMRRMMYQTLDYPGPIYIRVAKGGDPIVTPPKEKFIIGNGIRIKSGKDTLIISTGITLGMANDAVKTLKAKNINAGILHLPTLKPFDTKLLLSMAKKVKSVITIEEHSIIGGLGSIVSEVIAESGISGIKFHRIGFPDAFPKGYGSQAEQLEKNHITASEIVKLINK